MVTASFLSPFENRKGFKTNRHYLEYRNREVFAKSCFGAKEVETPTMEPDSQSIGSNDMI